MPRLTLAAALRACIILSNAAFAAESSRDYYGNAMPPLLDGLSGAGAADAQRHLAEYVCEHIHANTDTPESRCISNFLEPPPADNGVDPGGGAELCRGEDSIAVGVGRGGGGYRLALLVSDAGADDSRAEGTKTRNIRKAIGKSDELLTFEGVPRDARYRVWVAALDAAGRRAGPWTGRASAPRARLLAVTQFDEPADYEYREGGLSTTLSWNKTEDDNCDYMAWYSCEAKQPEEPVYITAGDTPSVAAHRLPFSADCRLYVTSSLGAEATEAFFNFTTPSCFLMLSAELCSPERPEGLAAQATMTSWPRQGTPSYSVRVTWTAPAHVPHNYTVSLIDGAGNYTSERVVDGLATEARFEDAPLTGSYHVMLIAAAAAGHSKPAIVIDRAVPKDWRWSREAVWAGASSAAVALALVAVLWFWHRSRQRRRTRMHIYFEELEKNAPKEMSVEAGLVSEENKIELRPETVVLFEVLGEGAFGVVRRGWHAELKKYVAVKMLKDKPLPEDVRAFQQEMEMMKSVGAHPNVVSLLDCVPDARAMMIVVEYCARGDLLHYLRCSWNVMASKHNQKLFDHDIHLVNTFRTEPEPPQPGQHVNLIVNKLYDVQGVCETELTAEDLLSFCRQIAMGMEFLASNRVVHRDLAARNVLVCADKTMKIADFGLSRDVYEDNQYKKSGNGKLPVKWMALESLTHQLYTTQSDVWSFGVVMWEAVTLGGAPYPGVSSSQLPRLLRSGYRMARPHNCSSEIYELMVACWRAAPRERPTFTELHRRLDALLHGACRKQYLSLDVLDLRDVESGARAPADQLSKYWGLIREKKRSGAHTRGRLTLYEKYVKPLYAWRSRSPLNHYSLTPKQTHPPALF